MKPNPQISPSRRRQRGGLDLIIILGLLAVVTIGIGSTVLEVVTQQRAEYSHLQKIRYFYDLEIAARGRLFTDVPAAVPEPTSFLKLPLFDYLWGANAYAASPPASAQEAVGQSTLVLPSNAATLTTSTVDVPTSSGSVREYCGNQVLTQLGRGYRLCLPFVPETPDPPGTMGCPPGDISQLIDFEGTAVYTNLSTGYNPFGVTFSWTGKPGVTLRAAEINPSSDPGFKVYNSKKCPGNPGHNRICNAPLPSNGRTAGSRAMSASNSREDDEAFFRVDYPDPVRHFEFDFLDLDANESWTVRTYTAASTLIATRKYSASGYGNFSGNNRLVRFSARDTLAQVKYATFFGSKKIKLFGWAFDNFLVCKVPAPITIYQATPSTATVAKGSNLSLQFTFSGGPTSTIHNLIVYFVDSGGTTAFQAVHSPSLATTAWTGGSVSFTRLSPIPTTAVPGVYTVRASLVDAVSGAPLSLTAGPSVTADGANRYLIGSVTITP